jgi:hypothetical protein
VTEVLNTSLADAAEELHDASFRLWKRDWDQTPLRDLALIPNFGDSLEWIVRNAPSIEAALVEFNMDRIETIVLGKPAELVNECLIPGETLNYGPEDRLELESIEDGHTLDWIYEHAKENWRNAFAGKVTIGSPASFEIRARWYGPGLFFRYRDERIDHRKEENRRSFVELDLGVLFALSKLVAPTAEAT